MTEAGVVRFPYIEDYGEDPGRLAELLNGNMAVGHLEVGERAMVHVTGGFVFAHRIASRVVIPPNWMQDLPRQVPADCQLEGYLDDDARKFVVVDAMWIEGSGNCSGDSYYARRKLLMDLIGNCKLVPGGGILEVAPMAVGRPQKQWLVDAVRADPRGGSIVFRNAEAAYFASGAMSRVRIPGAKPPRRNILA